MKTGGDGFLFEPQNQCGGEFLGLGFKTGSYGLVIWTSKSLRRFLGLGIKTKQASIFRLCHKTDGMMRRRGTCVRSSGLLHIEASLARVSQSGLKTGGGTTVGGVYDTIAMFASESNRRMDRCDGLRSTLLPFLYRFYSIRS
jgi:hypothetical protein